MIAELQPPSYSANHPMGARGMQAELRRYERDAQRRQRELARQAKEQAKLSAIEQAKLEVESYENKLEILLSVHKEQGKNWDWLAVLTSLPPLSPQKTSFFELRPGLKAALGFDERHHVGT
jgi:hypothetical protein